MLKRHPMREANFVSLSTTTEPVLQQAAFSREEVE